MEFIYDIKYKNNINLDKVKEIEKKTLDNDPLTENEVCIILDYIIYSTRQIMGSNIVNSCDLCQMLICNYLNKLGIKNNPNMTQESITTDITGHSFTIASFNTINGVKNYIVDPSYIQFFIKENCQKEKYFIYKDIILLKPSLGYFIRESDKSIVNEFLNNGYIEMTPINASIYGNSFYSTKVGINKDMNLDRIDGDTFIKSFLKGNVKLSEYDIKNIELLNDGYKSR